MGAVAVWLVFRSQSTPGGKTPLSFGLSARHTDLQVRSEAVAPFSLPSLTDAMNPFSSVAGIPILDYDQRFTSFNRFNAYLQDSIDLSNELLLSVGAKLEENDFAGFGFQPGSRLSWMVNDLNVLWAAYSKAHRQPSLRERYTTLSPLRYWVADLPVPTPRNGSTRLMPVMKVSTAKKWMPMNWDGASVQQGSPL